VLSGIAAIGAWVVSSQPADVAGDHLGEQALFVDEVLVDGLLGDGGTRRDVVHTRPPRSLLQEQLVGGLEYGGPLASRAATIPHHPGSATTCSRVSY
jgi:hypothetical protein